MRIHNHFIVCFLLIISFAQIAFAAEGNKAKDLVTAVFTLTAPIIDGKTDDAVWNQAREYSGFTQITEGNPLSPHPTFVRYLYDSHNLYLSFRCLQPAASLKATATPDGEVWNDDSVELFIKPHIATPLLLTRSPEERHFHLIFNSAGTKFDELGNGGATSWNGGWDVKTKLLADQWQAEVKIPFAALNDVDRPPVPFTSWDVQIARSTSADAGNSTLFPARGIYRNHENFGYLAFVEKAQDAANLRWNLDQQHVMKPGLDRLREALSGLKPMAGANFKQPVEVQSRTVDTLTEEFQAASQQDYSQTTQASFFSRLSGVEKNVRDLQEQMVLHKARDQGQGSDVAVAPHPAIKDQMLVNSDFLPAIDSIGKAIKATVTPGEYQAASFVLWSAQSLRNVMIDVSSLKGQAKVAGRLKQISLPAESVDVRWVKRWYQDGNGASEHVGNFLVPELLLKNPDLVTVDLKSQKNILLDYHPKESNGPVYLERSYPGDATTLQPLAEAAARTANQVWLTFHVPADTPPGNYAATIRIQSDKKIIAQIPVQLTVLDFKLAPSMLEHSWYVNSHWGNQEAPWQNQSRSLAEIRNLVRHGVTSVGLVESLHDFPQAVALMKQGGLQTERLYISDGGNTKGDAHFAASMEPQVAEKRALSWVEAAKKVGAKEIYLYLEDEAQGEVLKSERAMAEAIRKTGAKTWVATNEDFFPLAGDFIDAPVVSSRLVPELAAKVHGVGHKIYSYANPQGGIERPEIYRRNYGLRLWQSDYDGAFNWGWYQTFGDNFDERNTWDDFTRSYYRQHAMVYPTKTGVVDTIQWEGWREGVNDYRYLATLINEIARAKQEGRATPSVLKAETWMSTLKSSGEVGLSDLDSVRAEMIQQIQACRSAR